MFGGDPVISWPEPKYFKTVYVLSDIWQTAGYGSIVYLAALTSIDPSLYEAATVDGASKWKKLLHITLPCILPTIMTMLILRMGSIFTVGYEKIMLMYNPATYETADVISTYVYRRAFEGRRIQLLGGRWACSTPSSTSSSSSCSIRSANG